MNELVCGRGYQALATYRGEGSTYGVNDYDPAHQGCRHLISTGRICNDQDTVTVDGVHGRRCAAHPPEYAPRHYRLLTEAGQTATADAYLTTWLHIELERAETQPEEAAA